jgi:FtsP/CotA-like multicopper oxidase with cupredoxin domain
MGTGYADPDVWGYNGTVLAHEMRVRQGDRVRISVRHWLPEATRAHWHGVRLANAIDGVRNLTRKPIAPDETFAYEFDVCDADRYRYFSHQRSFEHGGRVRNTVTFHGRPPTPLQVRAGERVRLRLFNGATARIFALVFRNHSPLIIAMDGQPVATQAPAYERFLRGSAMRLDLLIDMTGEPGSRQAVRHSFCATRTYTLSEVVHSNESSLRRELLAAIRLPPNTMPDPVLDDAERHEVEFGGGMMGSMPADGIWSVNGISAVGQVRERVLELRLGHTYVLALNNATSWHQPIHLHRHSFRVLARSGRPTRFREWQDTLLMAPPGAGGHRLRR